MVVQHNIPAMNSHRNLVINNKGTSKNLEKLSSGYKINRAGDDAAGLAISEKMRGQIRGLAMAEQNASNGISLIQTAEGGLNETHAILQRMRELAVQSANGTYDDEVDRANIAKEVQALKSEMDRISSSTHYNGINLLDGSMGSTSAAGAATGAAAGSPEKVSFDNADKMGVAATAAFVFTTTASTPYVDLFKGETATFNVQSDGSKAVSATMQVGDKTYMVALAATDFGGKDSTGATIAANSVYEFTDKGMVLAGALAGFTAGSAKVSGDITKIQFNAAGATTESIIAADSKARVAVDSSQLIFQIGANGSLDQRVGLHVDNMSSGNLGIHEAVGLNTAGTVAGISVRTREAANDAIKVIDAATNQVSGTRAGLGALQNRLEHTLNNLGVTKENLQAAESSIRDVDMAKEMMEFTKNSILVQASQAMLAQANQLPQGVLQLLR